MFWLLILFGDPDKHKILWDIFFLDQEAEPTGVTALQTVINTAASEVYSLFFTLHASIHSVLVPGCIDFVFTVHLSLVTVHLSLVRTGDAIRKAGR